MKEEKKEQGGQKGRKGEGASLVGTERKGGRESFMRAPHTTYCTVKKKSIVIIPDISFLDQISKRRWPRSSLFMHSELLTALRIL